MKSKVVGLRISNEEMKKLKKLAEMESRTISNLLNLLIKKAIEESEKAK